MASMEEKRNKLGRSYGKYGGKEDCTHRCFLMRKPKVTVSLERPRRRCEGSIKMDHEETDLKILGWIYMVPVTDHWYASLGWSMELRVPLEGGEVAFSHQQMHFY